MLQCTNLRCTDTELNSTVVQAVETVCPNLRPTSTTSTTTGPTSTSSSSSTTTETTSYSPPAVTPSSCQNSTFNGSATTYCPVVAAGSRSHLGILPWIMELLVGYTVILLALTYILSWSLSNYFSCSGSNMSPQIMPKL